jgi:hypothetical protein
VWAASVVKIPRAGIALARFIASIARIVSPASVEHWTSGWLCEMTLLTR